MKKIKILGYLTGAFIVSCLVIRTVNARLYRMEQNGGDDKKFVEKALSAGAEEIRLGTLATERAAFAKVKAFGNMMIQDHRAANEELKTLARQKGYPVSDTAETAQAIRKLSSLSPGKFDHAFMKQMVADHEKVVKLFQQEAESGTDPEIRNWAQKTLPILQQHLDHARNIYNNLNTPDQKDNQH